MKITRRGFLKASAVTGVAALGLTGCEIEEEPLLDSLKEEKKAYQYPAGKLAEGKWVATGCVGCTSWCALEAYVVDGRVIKIRGNAKSKVNRGYACPRSHLAIQQLYDPDRIKTPMKRTNPKKGRNEDPKFVPISWDEAMDTLADKIMELRKNNETHKYVLFRGRYTELNELLYGNMTKIIGSPNNISHSSICAEAEKFGPYYTEGYWAYRDYDIANTKYVICWGADPLTSNRQVSHYSNAWGDLLKRAKIVTVDSRLTSTAIKSHEWMPVRTGEDGALASAFAHVILTEGLWSKEFVGNFTDGVNRFKVGQEVDESTFNETHTNGVVKWWNLELKDKTPAWAESISGVSADQIKRVAVEFAKAAPQAMVFMGGGPVMQARGGYNSMAVHALNGLVGSVDNVGGTIRGVSPKQTGLPSIDKFLDDMAKTNTKQKKIDQRGYKNLPAMASGKPGSGVVTNRAADGILDEDPYDVKVIFAYWINLAFSAPETIRWEKALAKVPFFAHCVTNISEMSHFADIVLPSTHSMFEQWGYHAQKGNAYTHLRCSQPMIDKVWDVKDAETEIVWLLAEKLAAKGFTNLLDYLKTIVDPETGKVPTNGEELALYMMKQKLDQIWNPAKHAGGDKFEGWNDFVAKGMIWNSGDYKFKGKWDKFETVTNKFEFYSETLKKALQEHADKYKTTIDDILETCNYLARGEQAFVPHYEEPLILGAKTADSLVLVDYKSRFNREGRTANCTWYQEFKDADPGDEKWEDVVKINPVDAARIGIKNGDLVKLISPAGEVLVKAALWEGAVPGSVSKTYGQGHWSYGRVAAKDFAKGIARGGNNNEIIPAEYERLSGSTVYYASTYVRIVKA